jgi:signal transduction histidine kinase
VALAIDHATLYAAAAQARTMVEAAGQAVRLRDQFLSVAAHELRTPITGLRGAIAVLRRPLLRGTIPPLERLLQMTGLADQEAVKLSRLVNQLFDLSRMESGKLALELGEVDLVEIARTVVERTRAQHPDAEIELQGAATIPAGADALRMEQVLTNLVDNAVKYSPQGGLISVACTTPRPGIAQLAVRDHGVGLAPEEHERIFERFYQVDVSQRAVGLGLGLYISREIVERHGGRIWVERPPDGGSRFVLEIPVSQGAK